MSTQRSKENRQTCFKYSIDDSPERKFGGPVNRIPQKTQSPIKQLDCLMADGPDQKLYSYSKKIKSNNKSDIPKQDINPKYSESQKSSTDFFIKTNNVPNDYLLRRPAENRSSILTKQPEAKGEATDETHNRRRQFDMRVNNIDKISEQISGLLDYVKKSENRAVSRTKTTSKTQKTQQQPSIILQQRKVRKSFISDLQTVRIKQQKPQNQEIQPKYKDYREQWYQKIQNKNNQRLNREKQIKYKQYKQAQFQQRYQQECQKKKKQGEDRYEKYQPKIDVPQRYSIDNIMKDFKEGPRSRLTPSRQTKEENNLKRLDMTPNKKKYEYKFENNTENKQVSEDENLHSQKLNSMMKIRYDKLNSKNKNQEGEMNQQISRLRLRIQSSEKRTYEMQKKYLKPNLNVTASREQKISEYKNVRKMGNQTSSHHRAGYLNKSTEVSQFKIKVHPVAQDSHQYKAQQKYQCMPSYTRASKQNNKIIRDSLDQDFKPVAQRIAGILSQQVTIDKNLRDARGYFSALNQPNKWRELQKQLMSKGFSCSQEQLQRQLSIQSNQYDPFLQQSVSSSKNYVKTLAECFIKSEKFWQQKISGIVTKQQIECSRFTVEQIDLNKKGYINVQDLVCFINLHTNAFYRNRDVLTLYRRFMALSKERQGIDKQSFLGKILK